MIIYPGVSNFGCVDMEVVFAKTKVSIEGIKCFRSLFVWFTIGGRERAVVI
jgi:hypothetical protein